MTGNSGFRISDFEFLSIDPWATAGHADERRYGWRMVPSLVVQPSRLHITLRSMYD